MDLKLKGKYYIRARMVVFTGLHIGGSSEGIEIGGVDNPVIKHPITEEPYIPGSSLKGKLRHLLEWSHEDGPKFNVKTPGKFQPCDCGNCEVCRLFGVSSSDTNIRQVAGPSRLTVYDAYLIDEENPSGGKRKYLTKSDLEKYLGENIYTEIKTENALDRVTSAANPRPLERVPAGAAFKVEMMVDIYQDSDIILLKRLFSGLALLEDSYLGGAGSRGSGRVYFEDLYIEWRPVEDYYRNGKNGKPVSLNEVKDVKDFVANFEKLFNHEKQAQGA
ncbi:MAG: type III-A CRISPR-associated RAMP protein Csm3 [candidate division KSB1 bacterium]|nr:type III-A CRISPR-associated RAMP protein Csm3 [candidate division KSB1 bacterium]